MQFMGEKDTFLFSFFSFFEKNTNRSETVKKNGIGIENL
jgi:hypothetical protein